MDVILSQQRPGKILIVLFSKKIHQHCHTKKKQFREMDNPGCRVVKLQPFSVTIWLMHGKETLRTISRIALVNNGITQTRLGWKEDFSKFPIFLSFVSTWHIPSRTSRTLITSKISFHQTNDICWLKQISKPALDHPGCVLPSQSSVF